MEVSPLSAGFETAELSLYASWGRRFLAWFLDGLAIWLALVVLTRIWRPSVALTLLLWILLAACYYVVLHGGSRGQTLGKRAVGIAVRDAESLGRLGYMKAFGRFFMTALFWALLGLPALLDGLWALSNTRHQTWHDKAVGSVVIRL